MSDVYLAQKGKIFCDTPMSKDGPIEIATCCQVKNMSAQEVAERLAGRLNLMAAAKNKANEKDNALQEVVSYLLSIESDDVPKRVRAAVLTAYEI